MESGRLASTTQPDFGALVYEFPSRWLYVARGSRVSGGIWPRAIRPLIPALLCLGVLCVILLAGLLPFVGPRNAVTWLPDQNGVRLAGRSSLWSSNSFPAAESGEASCSLELWLQPERPRDSSTIFSFSTAENPLQLTVHQYMSLLIVQTGTPHSREAASTIGTEGMLRQGTPVFATITSGPTQTVMYANGALSRAFPRHSIAADCSGQIVLGTSPVYDGSWHGQIRGLALYRQELTLDQVRRHYQTWNTNGRPDLDGERTLALYLFNERSGNVVHNAIPGGPDLDIPGRYGLLHQTFLEPFWEEYKPRWSYWKDILINIVGFMPLGLSFFSYWTSVRPIRRAALVTTALGLAVSLTIELLQSTIPTRDSGTTDLITNTLGTYLGVRLYGWGLARAALERIYSGSLR